MSPLGLLVAYCAANALGIVPISPGGLGIVEGALIPGLLVFSAPAAATVLAVLSWRSVEFWAPIPIGGLCYLSLRSRRWHRTRTGCPAVRLIG